MTYKPNEALETFSGIAREHGALLGAVGSTAAALALGRAWDQQRIAVCGSWTDLPPALKQSCGQHGGGTVTRIAVDRGEELHLTLGGKRFVFYPLPDRPFPGDAMRDRMRGALLAEFRQATFTIDALACLLLEDETVIIDPEGGLRDAERRELRATTDASAILRGDMGFCLSAFLKAGREGYTLAPGLLDAISQAAHRFAEIDGTAFRDTLLGLLACQRPSRLLLQMQECGMLKQFFPELEALAGVDQRSVEYPGGVRDFHHKDVFHHTLKVLDNLCHISDDVWLRMSALLHDIAKPRTKAFHPDTGWTFHGHAEIGARMVRKIFRRLELPEAKGALVEKLVALHLRPISLVRDGVTDSAIRRLLADAGGQVEQLLTLCKADITSKNPALVRRYLRNYELLRQKMTDVQDADQLRSWQPPLRGDEIMEICGIAPGVLIGVLKTRIEDAILDGRIPNTREAALAFLAAIKDDVLAQPVAGNQGSVKRTLKRLPANIKP